MTWFIICVITGIVIRAFSRSDDSGAGDSVKDSPEYQEWLKNKSNNDD